MLILNFCDYKSLNLINIKQKKWDYFAVGNSSTIFPIRFTKQRVELCMCIFMLPKAGQTNKKKLWALGHPEKQRKDKFFPMMSIGAECRTSASSLVHVYI